MAKRFLSLMKNFSPHILEAPQTVQTHKTTKLHLGQYNQTLKTKEKEKILKAGRVGIHREYKETARKTRAVFSQESRNQEGNRVTSLVLKKNCQPRILHLWAISFKTK